MVRLFSIASVVMTAAFALLLVGARAQPGADLTAYFGACAMPCWQQVQPGATLRTEALARLKAQGWRFQAQCNPGVYTVCYDFTRGETEPVAFVYVADEQVQQIALFRAGLTLGDLWLAFGAPDSAAISPRSYRAPFLNTAAWFSLGGVSTRQRFPCPTDYARMLHLPVDTLLVWSPGTAMLGEVFSATGDLRRAIHAVCGA